MSMTSWGVLGGAIAQVGLGGALGAICRYLVVRATERWTLVVGAPVGVTLANVIGGLAIGFLAVALAQAGLLERWRPLLFTGFLGGFTTFSAFSLDAVTLFQQGRADLAFGYIGVNVAGAIGAAALGAVLARGWFGA